MFDAEHSANNARAIDELVRTATLAGLASYVRIPDPYSTTDVTGALESGAEGLVFPEVHSVEDINAAANAAYFPPKGNRSICPATCSANFDFRHFVDFTERNNRAVTLVPEIENPDGVAQIEEICAHPDVQMVIFGEGDFAFSRGEGNAMDKGTQTARDFQTVLGVARKYGVAVVGGPFWCQQLRHAARRSKTVYGVLPWAGLDVISQLVRGHRARVG